MRSLRYILPGRKKLKRKGAGSRFVVRSVKNRRLYVSFNLRVLASTTRGCHVHALDHRTAKRKSVRTTSTSNNALKTVSLGPELYAKSSRYFTNLFCFFEISNSRLGLSVVKIERVVIVKVTLRLKMR